MLTGQAPTRAEIETTRDLISPWIDVTPVVRHDPPGVAERFGGCRELIVKHEQLQRTGSFKPRGALSVMLRLAPAARERGVVTVSAGNHAIAVAYAARALGVSAHVVMPRSASALRVRRAEGYGAVVELVEDVHVAFERVREIQATTGRTFVHPFEGPATTLGTATLGLEFCEQSPPFDALVVPIGGGGLCAGVAAAVRLANPQCVVYGVEPEGANAMQRSLRAGSPQALPEVRTVADSLAPPRTEAHAFELCRQFVREVVTVTDPELQQAMRLLLEELRVAVEPAAAAATAALCGPLRGRFDDARVGMILCGTNIDAPRFLGLAAVPAQEATAA